MREFASRALRYRQGLGRETVFTDPLRLDASLRNLELLEEVAKSVPVAFRICFQAPRVALREGQTD
ncbi:nucleotidyltransferase [Thermus scotoductus]|uniref:Nucleotidyltransferase n=1 Tax=Thermus scotoductus TaxID=37636 RepID=A0A430UHY4_THESC|nr:nucleotidyltransferase [Thermus scotoductus]RTI01310.1 nucleotidyltransferase [Thermus scotoductus]